jgi:L-ascorbate metabolism protein UlaG (beta-lactamase superfamily)
MGINVTWLGHAGFSLDLGGITVLIDPFITGNPLANHDIDTLAADYILLTHAHRDHVGDSLAIAKRTDATIVGIVEVSRWFSKQGIRKTHGQNIGGGYTHPFGHLKLVRADHSSSFPDGSYGGLACGLVLTTQGKRLYFAGDTALYSDMRLIGDLGIDCAFLPIGDNFTMGPDEAVAATKLIRPRAVFPIHYNTFEIMMQDPAAWARRVHNETNSRALVTDPGETFSIP